MTEILTESFCERCGTRYTFESSAPRQRKLGGLKVLGRGLKNFVLSDDSSLDEAMAAARSDAERDATAHQLDAFHRTFNFCMSCRQYTCANCWNEVEARCLSCAPLALAEAAPVLDEVDADRLLRFMGAPTVLAPGAADEPVAAHHHVAELIGDEVHDAEVAAEAEAAAQAESLAEAAAAQAEGAAEAEALASPAAQAAEAIDLEPVRASSIEPPPDATAASDLEDAKPSQASEEIAAAAEPAVVPVSEVVVADLLEPAAPIDGFEPGQSIDDAIAAYEATLDGDVGGGAGPVAPTEALPAPSLEEAGGVEATYEPVAPMEAQAEVAVEPASEPAADIAIAPAADIAIESAETIAPAELEAAAEAAPGGEPVAEDGPAPQPEPEPEAEAASGAPGVDVIEQPTWPAAAAPAGGPAESPSPVPTPAAPSWPTGPRWPTSVPARPTPAPTEPVVDPLAAFMARTATDAMWAASSRDVVRPVAAAQAVAAVQPCTKCGISLSATARFCRRCGTPQG